MKLVHYTSATPDVHAMTLDPSRFGEHKETAGDKRSYGRPRVYFYTGDHKKESWLGHEAFTADVPDEDLYDIEEDPGNIKDERDPEDPRRLVHFTPGSVINEVLKRGFKGVHYNTSWGRHVAIFEPVEVKRAE